MLTKVSYSNYQFGTEQIIKFSIGNKYDIIQDNLEGLLLISYNHKVYLYNYFTSKFINYNRIPLIINGLTIWKQIDSFDQNNPKICSKIRNQAINYLKFNKSNNILGIGGEFYVYFKLLDYSKYIGISNHKSIISDSEYNFSLDRFKKVSNSLVDYDKEKTFPTFDSDEYDIIINVVNIHENIIKYISKLNCKKIIIITCKPFDKKIKMLSKYLTLKKITHFVNINSLVSIGVFIKKIK